MGQVKQTIHPAPSLMRQVLIPFLMERLKCQIHNVFKVNIGLGRPAPSITYEVWIIQKAQPLDQSFDFHFSSKEKNNSLNINKETKRKIHQVLIEKCTKEIPLDFLGNIWMIMGIFYLWEYPTCPKGYSFLVGLESTHLKFLALPVDNMYRIFRLSAT